ncbi:baseplate J/gp47 family protein [Collinsella tanakaei]|uniref:baseplate J/gp47 family protein n=1 Tax=Collinsella tanakaei TaxID=626935 RepID=UPI00195A4DA7|nr:baseplate J/gp47 family protein [Collinsella tanakaei]MBM6756695.1 baseplate J/gp47 family protein [Collinsella tanakaei]
MAGSTDTYDERLDLIDVDSSSIYTDVVTGLESGVGEPLYPGDERRIFGEALVAALVAYVSKANDAARQTMLRYARGQVLDAIGERLGVERIDATPSECMIRFTLSAPQDRTITIPAMTRVTSDGSLYWQTESACAIPAGELTGDVAALCTEGGGASNGVPAGEIATLVDLQPYVSSVANIDATHGGDDGEPYTTEGDDRLRERIRLAPNRLSVAGPEQAYVYWALTADPDIADVAAFSEEHDEVKARKVVGGHVYVGGDLLVPEDVLLVDGSAEGFTWTYSDSLLDIDLGETEAETAEVTVRRKMDGRVKVVPLMAGGGLPDEETLRKVYETVNDKTIRPMTDLVTVEAPTTVGYAIRMKYWTRVEDEAAIMEAVEGAGGAVDRYIADQCAVLGRDINPYMLQAYVMDAGAIKCDVYEPQYVPVTGVQVARLTGAPDISHALETKARWSE